MDSKGCRTEIYEMYSQYIKIQKVRDEIFGKKPKQVRLILQDELEKVKHTQNPVLCYYFAKAFRDKIDTSSLEKYILSSNNEKLISAYYKLKAEENEG